MTKKKKVVPKAKEPRRQFDLRIGARTVSVGVRFTPEEFQYIQITGKKKGISNAAVVCEYFKNWKESLGH